MRADVVFLLGHFPKTFSLGWKAMLVAVCPNNVFLAFLLNALESSGLVGACLVYDRPGIMLVDTLHKLKTS